VTARKPAERIEARQHLDWLLAAELELAPTAWGRPLRANDVRLIASTFDPDKFGAICVWRRNDLAIGHGRYVTIDGQHRLAAIRLMGYADQRVPSLIYDGLTMETAAELSLGLQERRNLHPLDKHRANLAAHDRRAIEIDKVLARLDLELSYHTRFTVRGRVSCVAQLYYIWDCLGATGLERVLEVANRAWDGTSPAFASAVLRLIMVLVGAHDGVVDDVHLSQTLSARSPSQWLMRDVVPPRSVFSIAQDVAVEYNRKLRGAARLAELTPSQYMNVKRPANRPTTRGKIDGNITSGGPAPKMGRGRK